MGASLDPRSSGGPEHPQKAPGLLLDLGSPELQGHQQPTGFVMSAASADYESRYGHHASLYGVDAAFIALEHSLPTLNGYSAWSPEGWSLADPPHPWYPAALAA